MPVHAAWEQKQSTAVGGKLGGPRAPKSPSGVSGDTSGRSLVTQLPPIVWQSACSSPTWPGMQVPLHPVAWPPGGAGRGDITIPARRSLEVVWPAQSRNTWETNSLWDWLTASKYYAPRVVILEQLFWDVRSHCHFLQHLVLPPFPMPPMCCTAPAGRLVPVFQLFGQLGVAAIL